MAPTQRPVIALLTDFGTRDAYVGVMKGVILGVCPEAALVDLTHTIPPQDVRAAALTLLEAVPYFPPHAVFLCVVDPGVGSDRRALAVRCGRTRFVAPDNGLIAPALEHLTAREEHRVTTRVIPYDSPYTLPHSNTFHGRDIFAPIAGHLARGVAFEAIGERGEPPMGLELPEPTLHSAVPLRVHGHVWSVDHFGNLRTNIPGAWLEGLEGQRFALTLGEERYEAPLAESYARVGRGDLLLIVGSSGTLEVSVSMGDAASAVGARSGDAFDIEALEPP